VPKPLEFLRALGTAISDLLAGCEDLTQRRRDSQRVAESSFSLRFSAFLCVSALRLFWLWLRLCNEMSWRPALIWRRTFATAV